MWKFTADGQYTAKSAYEVQFRGSFCSFRPQCIWSAYAEPKHRFFTWLLVQERILTADKLQDRIGLVILCVRSANLPLKQHNISTCSAPMRNKFGRSFNHGPMIWYVSQTWTYPLTIGGSRPCSTCQRNREEQKQLCLCILCGTCGRRDTSEPLKARRLSHWWCCS